MRAPFEQRVEGEDWRDHDKRLRKILAKEATELTERYDVGYFLVNAANYGVPQVRWRVLVVAFRRDLGLAGWEFPAPTHSEAACCASRPTEATGTSTSSRNATGTPLRCCSTAAMAERPLGGGGRCGTRSMETLIVARGNSRSHSVTMSSTLITCITRDGQAPANIPVTHRTRWTDQPRRSKLAYMASQVVRRCYGSPTARSAI